MHHLFYLVAIAFIFYELRWITSPREKSEELKERELLFESMKVKKYKNENPEERKAMIAYIWMLFLVIWLFVGLMTYNWVLFAVYLTLSIPLSAISKVFKYNYIYILMQWLWSLVGALMAVFVIVNKYHLRIDLYELIKTWLY